MTKVEKINKLKGLLAPLVENHGAFMVDVNLRGEGNGQLIEVFCDEERGITIDKCAEISRSIMPALESSDALQGSFRLEVSSPGVGTPIKDRRQYKSNFGRLFSVECATDEGVKKIEGDLVELKENGIVLKSESGNVELDLSSIVEARVKIRW